MQVSPKVAGILLGVATVATLASYGWGKGAGEFEGRQMGPEVTKVEIHEKAVKVPGPTVTKTTNTVPQVCTDLIAEYKTNIKIQKELADLPDKAYTVSQMNIVLEVAGRESDSTDRIQKLEKSCNSAS